MNGNNGYAGNDITPEILKYSSLCTDNCRIEPQLYIEHKVNRGLRDLNGKGVLTGLTEISEIVSKKIVNGEEVPCRGKLYYRGYDVEQLVAGFIRDGRFGFEEIVYLLLFASLPNAEQLSDFCSLLSSYRTLPGSFVRDIIMKAPSANMMNSLARSVLTLYSYDTNAEDTSIPNVLRQCLQLIARFPLLSVYGYHSYDYYLRGSNSFFIHEPRAEHSTAENILYMLRIDGKYTQDDTEMHKEYNDSVGLFSDWRRPGPVYELPFGALTGRKITNLLAAGRCISATDAMWDITRVIPVCALSGQAAGTAAAMTDNFDGIDINKLQDSLKLNGVILHESEILSNIKD